MNSITAGSQVLQGVPDYSFSSFQFDIKYKLKKIGNKGNLVYEYNPFRNFRVSKDDLANNLKEGMLVDFDTEKLSFDLSHPLNIECQTSYDGSTNLIINDGINQPKLINSRFTPLEGNTYKVVDREGNNDTNIYDDDQFQIDTSLYKRIITIPTVEFLGLNNGGNMRVGNYVFYFKYCDSDGNETDFIEESSIVTCHIGNINDPFSIRGGIRDENSRKSINFLISNTDSNYEYLTVYGTRSSSDVDGNELTTAFKIEKKYLIKGGSAYITINGYENTSDIAISDINTTYNVVSSAKAQAQCQNMLFLGNVSKPDVNYKELTDLSLRFLPFVDTSASIGNVDPNYKDSSEQYEYYNALNIYNKTGYWDNELYRLGIVYILENNTLSPVFNVRGKDGVAKDDISYTDIPLYSGNNRKYIEVNENDYSIANSQHYLENSKGVIRIESGVASPNIPVIGIGMKASKETLDELKKYVKGFFFVRQKRIPTILAQAITLGLEKESCLPTIPVSDNEFLLESFITTKGVLSNSFSSHKRLVNRKYVTTKAALCPEYELRKSYFNSLFTGSSFVINDADKQPKTKFRALSNERMFSIDEYQHNSVSNYQTSVKVLGIDDNTQLIVNKLQKYRARAGAAEEAWKFNFIEKETVINYSKTKDNNIIRGSFGPYIGLDNYQGEAGRLINIYIPKYDPHAMKTYFGIRYDDSLPYYAISRRISLNEVSDSFSEVCYRGDCFIGNFTHRMNRNFQDSESPTNDIIIDLNTWKDNYEKGDTSKNAKINKGDINAVQLGHWVTFKVRSSINLSMRDVDKSYPEEEGMTGLPRNFYPLYSASTGGESKIPESGVINGGFGSTTSDMYYFIMPNVPAIKNDFNTRILYSDININDAFKNGFRVFRSKHFMDYPRTYGGITKILELFGNLLIVFEHGVALVPVNERAVAAEGSGGNVFINTSNVLPENPKMLSDTFGSQWSESVIKTPYFVYGIDTVGKKIWRTNGAKFEIISDFKIQKFLNDNITLTEREITPIVGIRNVKTHYNAFKQDVMFTFYDNLYGFEEKAWNLCYNETMQKFITFYSWMPSYSANIHNVFFTFDRKTSKDISKLWSTLNNDSIQLTKNEISINVPGTTVGTLSLANKRLPKLGTPTVTFTLERDSLGNYKNFEIVETQVLQEKIYTLKTTKVLQDKVYGLNIRASISTIADENPSFAEYMSTFNNYQTINSGYYENTLNVATTAAKNGLTTNFWKHGQAGIFNITDKIKPCCWYGESPHPFEFEFIVVDNPSIHKIFESLNIISNKAVPESLHFEVVGECYNFADDKQNMYFRQEATKHVYQYNGSDINYNKNYLDIKPSQRDIPYSSSAFKDKSAMFPLYYSRVDRYNDIEDSYQRMTSVDKDYQHLSGSEIVYDDLLNEFKVATHIKASPFDSVYWQPVSQTRYNKLFLLGYVNNIKADSDSQGNQIAWYELMDYGRLRGNMQYKEDKWDVEIPCVSYWERNELAWPIGNPPLNLANNPLPEDVNTLSLASQSDIPKELVALGYGINTDSFDVTKWSDIRKEARLKDKFIKIKIRYTGKDLAIITALKTLYTVSYA